MFFCKNDNSFIYKYDCNSSCSSSGNDSDINEYFYSKENILRDSVNHSNKSNNVDKNLVDRFRRKIY